MSRDLSVSGSGSSEAAPAACGAPGRHHEPRPFRGSGRPARIEADTGSAIRRRLGRPS